MVQIVCSTFPDEATATSIGKQLVAEKLTACIHIVAGIKSIYTWKDQLEEQPEVLAIFKVSSTTVTAFMERLKTLHPYEVPEIWSVTPENVLPAYAQWVEASCDDSKKSFSA